MTFDSLTFVIFFAIVLAVYYWLRSWELRKLFLTTASYLFYAAWNPPFVLLLWFSTLADWTIAKAMVATERPSRRKLLIIATLAVNLGLLGFFKYSTFLLQNFKHIAAYVGLIYQEPALDIVLPVGISFYTFQTLSYTIDVYRGELKPPRRFTDYALFVAFFPQLVAGPIVRGSQFLPQLLFAKSADIRKIGWGLVLITIGLFQKTVVADYVFSPVADSVFDNTGIMWSASDTWTGMLAFSGQIFCDFSGYSLCAIGAALCLGFHIPENFNSPYAAASFSDFWRRWHISLSTWLRDYLYISLGGNRDGRVKTYRNLILTMLIGGLWHGAAWGFIVWGMLHGLYLAMERYLSERLAGWSTAVSTLWLWPRLAGVFLVVTLTWVFFRAPTLGRAIDMLSSALGAGETVTPQLASMSNALVGVTLGLLLSLQWSLRNISIKDALERLAPAARVAVIAAMLVSIVLTSGDGRAFIYFQF